MPLTAPIQDCALRIAVETERSVVASFPVFAGTLEAPLGGFHKRRAAGVLVLGPLLVLWCYLSVL